MTFQRQSSRRTGATARILHFRSCGEGVCEPSGSDRDLPACRRHAECAAGARFEKQIGLLSIIFLMPALQ
jgi:hypothetical protein